MNNDVIEQHLEQYHQLARKLHESTDREQATLALKPLVDMADEDQIAYLKALGQEQSSDAADVAQALYNIAPNEEVRQEARRALLSLEAQNICPSWNITTDGLVARVESGSENLPTGTGVDPESETLTNLDTQLQDLEDFLDSLPGSSTLEPVTALLESWGDGDPEDAYEALAPSSSLREGLDADAWAERRTRWIETADTGLVNIAYIGEKEKLSPDSVVVEATWSLSISNPTAENPPKDLPTATCVFKETERHWFWTSYLVVEEDGEWHITEMTDEGTQAMQLPPEEIERILREKAANAAQRLAELEDDEDEDFDDLDEDEDEDEDFDDMEDEELDDEDEDDEDDEDDEYDEDTLHFLEEIEAAIGEATQALHYHDAYLHQVPDVSPAIYESAVEFAQIVQDPERAAAYYEQMAERIPEVRWKALCGLAMMYEQILQGYLANDPEDPEEIQQYFDNLIEETLRQASEVSLTIEGSILFADVLIRQNKNLDEAEALLNKILLDTVSIEKRLADVRTALQAQREQ